MGIREFFQPVPSLSADEVRQRLADLPLGDYSLIDVRQPKEYTAGHLPGAMLIPLRELGERLAELDPGLPTFVY